MVRASLVIVHASLEGNDYDVTWSNTRCLPHCVRRIRIEGARLSRWVDDERRSRLEAQMIVIRLTFSEGISIVHHFDDRTYLDIFNIYGDRLVAAEILSYQPLKEA